jgi:hypothetical protein
MRVYLDMMFWLEVYSDVATGVAEDVLQSFSLVLAYLAVVCSPPSCISGIGMSEMQDKTQLCNTGSYKATVVPEDPGVQGH